MIAPRERRLLDPRHDQREGLIGLLFFGHIGAAAGSASGVVWSLFSSMFGWMTPSQPSDVHVNYVNMCLAERGYQVAGWK